MGEVLRDGVRGVGGKRGCWVDSLGGMGGEGVGEAGCYSCSVAVDSVLGHCVVSCGCTCR